MSEVFLKVLNMSISASWIVLVVLLLRLALKKAPRWITVLLWGIVAVRLVCPVSIESVLSLIPSAETVSPDIMMDWTPQIDTGIPVLNNAVNPVISGSFAPSPMASANPLQILIPVFSLFWIAGMAVMLLYTLISCWRVKRKVRAAVPLQENIYQCDAVGSPFVFGVVKPKIYLPVQMNGQDMELVIAHEQAHIRRKDHLWKPLGFLILTLHWFNPLLWLGYVLLCRDIELACDEKVIKELDTEQKADYSQALLTCSIKRRTIAACPLAFGEVGVKDRIKAVFHYKKPAFWIIVVAVVLCIAVAVCFLTDPKITIPEELSVFIDGQICDHHYSAAHTGDNFVAVHHEVLGVEKFLNKTTVYMWVLYHEYEEENGVIKNVSGAHIPTVITAKSTGLHGHYELVEYWEPGMGSQYVVDIRDRFPWYLQDKAIDSERYIKKQLAFCDNAAEEYYGLEMNRNEFIDLPEETIAVTVDEAFYNLDTTKGLEVYIWQMAQGQYSCVLLPGRNLAYTEEDLWELHQDAVSMEKMRQIVASYDLPREMVAVIPTKVSHSSYYYTVDAAYVAQITELFWSELPVAQTGIREIIDQISFDIDGDGEEEHCVLTPGSSYGIFTFAVSVFDQEGLEYYNVFTGPWMQMHFEGEAGGDLRLVGDQGVLNLKVKDGNIYISGIVSSTEDMEYMHWGEQGKDSFYAPIIEIKTTFEATGTDVLTYHLNTEQFVTTKTHYELKDGYWMADGRLYRYRLEVTGRMHNAAKNTTYVILSNKEQITFDQAWRASGFSSNMDDYFDPADAVIVGYRMFE